MHSHGSSDTYNNNNSQMVIKMNLRVYREKWKDLWWIDTAYNLKKYMLSYKIVENLF